MAMVNESTAARPVLITSARPSYDEQYAERKRRYTTLMGGRLLLFVLAAVAYPMSPWLAVGLLALSLPLPWMAVLIANDAPARRNEDNRGLAGRTTVRELEARPHPVVDASEAIPSARDDRSG